MVDREPVPRHPLLHARQELPVRFRHTAQFKRWRPDRDPESCGYEQLEEPVGYDLGEVLGG